MVCVISIYKNSIGIALSEDTLFKQKLGPMNKSKIKLAYVILIPRSQRLDSVHGSCASSVVSILLTRCAPIRDECHRHLLKSLKNLDPAE